MNREAIDNLVRAVLYEGYMLYPYRPSVKSRQRWTFGGLYPKAWSDAQAGSDACALQTEVLVDSRTQTNAAITVVIQFLHLLERTTGQSPADAANQPWQEAVERRIEVGTFHLDQLLNGPHCETFTFPADRILETAGAATVIRDQQALQGEAELSCIDLGRGLFKVTIRVQNQTDLAPGSTRDDALMRTLVSTNVVLGIEGAQFVSATDPTETCRAEAEACKNIGVWPVLVGEEGSKDTLLASPIILYDYPRLAPESPGDLYDGTEIDEILTLRILTLTDEEKRAGAGNDERVRELLSRTENLAREHLMNLHGVLRPVAPSAIVQERHHD